MEIPTCSTVDTVDYTVLSPYEQGFIAIIPLLESVKCDFLKKSRIGIMSPICFYLYRRENGK